LKWDCYCTSCSYGLNLCMAWWWLVNRVETCYHIRRYIKWIVLDGYCCAICCDILHHNGMDNILKMSLVKVCTYWGRLTINNTICRTLRVAASPLNE
jgi:hypothetical protein